MKTFVWKFGESHYFYTDDVEGDMLIDDIQGAKIFSENTKEYWETKIIPLVSEDEIIANNGEIFTFSQGVWRCLDESRN